MKIFPNMLSGVSIMNKIKVKKLLQEFFIEDLGENDMTSSLIFPIEQVGVGTFLAKADGIVAGLNLIEEAYHLFDSSIQVTLFKKDGEETQKGDPLAEVKGPVSYLLSGERVILNLIQHMSGIASATNQAVKLLSSSHTRICDTRKTLPGLRMFEKYAVRCGGGFNHRLGLYDGVMIKDNHIANAGSIESAVNIVRNQIGHMVKIEVEAETKQDVMDAVAAKADVIMFDNCSPEQVKEYVSLVPGGIVTEISGGITLENISGYRDTMVDYISLGMLTHSVKAFDISFNLKGGRKG